MNLVNVTSIAIFIPAIVALSLKRWTDVLVISTQAFTSVIYHSNNTQITLFMDRLALVNLIIRTFLLSIHSYSTISLYLVGFGYMSLIYMYGFYNKCFSFDSRDHIADRYHSSIHVVGILIYSGSMIWLLDE